MKNNQINELEEFIVNLVIVIDFIAIVSMSLIYMM